MGRESRETWAKRVERWSESGLTAAEFAAELGISPGSLKWWKWRLAAEPKTVTAEPKTVAARPSARRRSAAIAKAPSSVLSPLTFVEMTSPVVSEASLEVVLPSTMRIRVRPGFDDVTLGRLLDVLERRR